jgi:hypothetical protein
MHVLRLCHEMRQVHAELLPDVQLRLHEDLRLYEKLRVYEELRMYEKLRVYEDLRLYEKLPLYEVLQIANGRRNAGLLLFPSSPVADKPPSAALLLGCCARRTNEVRLRAQPPVRLASRGF